MIRQLASDLTEVLLRSICSTRFIYGSLGGLVFLGIFYFGYGNLDPETFKYRDDGVITLSHARNFVDYGHIGVDPSGKRLEGFSSPVQFWIYAAVYGLTGIGWDTFADIQTLLCTFLLGFIFLQFFEKNWIMGLMGGFFAAWFMQFHHSFYLWHASGMENPWTHVLFMGSALLLFRAFRGDHIQFRWAGVLFLASISRLDSIFHLAPMALTWALMWYSEYRTWRSFHLIGLAFTFWGIYQFWRWYYFGTLLPNSGLAQGIDVQQNISYLWGKNLDHLIESLRWARIIANSHGVWFLLPLLFFLPFTKVNRDSQFFLIITGVMTATVFLNPAIFGMTRLDPGRSTTFLVPFISLLLTWQFSQLQLFKQKNLVLSILVPVTLFIFIIYVPAWAGKPHPLCCSAVINEEIILEGEKFARENKLHRLNVAAPDLGKLSYTKLFNLTDLGYLGSPIMAHFRDRPAQQVEYFFNYALPDLVEVHGPWCETYRQLLSDPRFREMYEPIRESKNGLPEALLRKWPLVRTGIYVRKALITENYSLEWQLIQQLQQDLNPDHLWQYQKRLMHKSNLEFSVLILRTAYRFLPEFESNDQLEAVIQIFEGSPIEQYGKAILMSRHWRNWETEAINYLEERLPILVGSRVAQ